MIRNRHFVTKDVRAKKFYQRKGSLVENDSFGMEGNLTVLGKEIVFRSSHFSFLVFGQFWRLSHSSHIFVFWFLVDSYQKTKISAIKSVYPIFQMLKTNQNWENFVN